MQRNASSGRDGEQVEKGKKNTGEEREILIWYNMRKKANSNQSHGDDAKETCEVKVDELKISRDREV